MAIRSCGVALRKESVDRNTIISYTIDNKRKVALRKESVDRNLVFATRHTAVLVSLSARRAWIEMPEAFPLSKRCAVALRKESVDRNRGVRGGQ